MEHARECAHSEVKDIETLELINHVRMFKHVFLPCELLRKSGRECTEASVYDIKLSQLKWTFYHQCVEQPSRRYFKAWKQFLEWLRKQRVKTMYDFEAKVRWKWQLRDDRKVLIVTEETEKRHLC